MRNAFVRTLEEEVSNDSDIVLLTGDLGFSVFDDFREKYPDNFLNMGIAEQNMIGVAAGLSMAGKKPVVYSIIPFIAFRGLEQVRNDVCYQDLNVTLVGVGSGFSYGPAGFSHHALADVGSLRPIPNLSIMSPSDPLEVQSLLRKSIHSGHPSYIRLGKNNEPVLSPASLDLAIGDIQVLEKGRELALISHGSIMGEVHAAYTALTEDGYSPTLVSVPTIKPFNEEGLKKILQDHRDIVVIEEVNRIGGLGDALFSHTKNNPYSNSFLHVAVPDEFTGEIGSSGYLRKKHGLDGESLYHTIKKFARKP